MRPLPTSDGQTVGMWIFAHRGVHATRAQENSVEAFSRAVVIGCHIETDARCARDGGVVLAHDAFVGTLVRRKVSTMSASALNRRGIPSIDALFDCIGSTTHVSVDLKDTSAAAGLIESARAVDAVDRLWLVTDQLQTLERLRHQFDDVRLVHEARGAEVPDFPAHSSRLSAIGVNAQNTDVFELSHDDVCASHAAGLLIFGSLANDRARLERARDMTIDAIYTDRPAFAFEVLT